MDSSPRDLKPYDKAYKLRRQQEDEQAWVQGQYILSAFATVMSQAFSKHSNAKYIEKPFFSDLFERDVDENPEANEILAAAEMMKFAEVMRQQGLPES